MTQQESGCVTHTCDGKRTAAAGLPVESPALATCAALNCSAQLVRNLTGSNLT
jgi:hypothetical protein